MYSLSFPELLMAIVGVISTISLAQGAFFKGTVWPWTSAALKVFCQVLILAVNLQLHWWLSAAFNALAVALWGLILIHGRERKVVKTEEDHTG